MVGRVNVKASQRNKKPIVVHIDRVLYFDASGSEKEQTENIHCIGIDLEAEREWARLDREKALGQQEDEEEEEQEVQWHIRRRTGKRIAPSSFLFRNEAARDGAKSTDSSSSFSSTSSNGRKRPRATLDTSALFLIRNARNKRRIRGVVDC
jgi:hypothetical protein